MRPDHEIFVNWTGFLTGSVWVGRGDGQSLLLIFYQTLIDDDGLNISKWEGFAAHVIFGFRFSNEVEMVTGELCTKGAIRRMGERGVRWAITNR